MLNGFSFESGCRPKDCNLVSQPMIFFVTKLSTGFTSSRHIPELPFSSFPFQANGTSPLPLISLFNYGKKEYNCLTSPNFLVSKFLSGVPPIELWNFNPYIYLFKRKLYRMSFKSQSWISWNFPQFIFYSPRKVKVKFDYYLEDVTSSPQGEHHP